MPALPGGDAHVDHVIEDGEDAQATENISKEEAAEMLLVCCLPHPGPDGTLTVLLMCADMCVAAGDGKDHRRTKRNVGGEAEKNRIHSAREVTIPPLFGQTRVSQVKTKEEDN